MLRLPILVAWICAELVLAGCSSVGSGAKPAVLVPDESTGKYTYQRLSADFEDYQKCFTEGQLSEPAKARQIRDRMIIGVRSEIDAWYLQLEEDLFNERARFNTWADFLELGLTGAIGITNGHTDKTVLTAILSAGKGTRLSYDKNWFREKTTEVLVTAMRAERTKVLTTINEKMLHSTAVQYSFEEARGDLIAYFEAGTLQGALVALSTTTGEQAAVAKKALDTQTNDRIKQLKPATAAAIKSVAALTQQLDGMKEERARKILAACAVTVPADAKLDDLLQLLRDQIDKLPPDDAAGLKKLSDAFDQNK